MLTFPFVDRLNDGHSSFNYAGRILLPNETLVVEGASVYEETSIGTFDPPCAGYASVAGRKGSEIFLNGYNGSDQALGKAPSFKTKYETVEWQPYPIDL